MSGLRRLFREAARAGAFIRRLERSLEPARLAASPSGDWALLRIDERLAGLIDAADPFSTLENAVARIAVRPAADEHELRIVRHLEAGPHPIGGRGHSTRHPTAARTSAADTSARPNRRSGDRKLFRSSRETSSWPPDLLFQRLEAAPYAPDPHASANVRPTAFPPALRELGPPRPATADWSAMEPRAVRAPGPGPLHSVAAPAIAVAASRAPGQSHAAAAPPAVASIPYVSPSHAAEILNERMHASNTLQAFRSVVRVAASAQPDPERPAFSSVVGGTLSDQQPPLGEAFVRRVPEPAAALQPAATDAPASSDRPVDAAHASRRRTSQPVVETTLSGLRRLAALATESLDDPGPSVEPVRPSQPVLCVEEELDRILRAEALRHGLHADGLVR